MSVKTVSAIQAERNDDYAAFEQLIRDRVAEVEGPVFETDALPDTLWREWLEAIPQKRRQHYNCACCRHFIQKYGRLVTINEDGDAEPLLWMASLPEVPEFFRAGVLKLDGIVSRAKVTGVFLWGEKESVWGTPKTRADRKENGVLVGGVIDWTHLSGVPKVRPFSHPLRTASQEAADKKQDYQILSHGLSDYPPDVAAQALRVLESDSLYRSEKALGVAKWLVDLHTRLDGRKGRVRSNLIWLAVATAPVGFCHVRSTIISTLLDDVKAGLPFATIAKRWADKTHPLQYQRPTAPPKTGAIEEAEKVFAKTGAARSLERRFARLDDVLVKLWVPPTPAVEEKRGGAGLFDHLRSDKQPVREVELPSKPVTWEKFKRDVLPTAQTVEALVPSVGPFYGLVTATHPDAPAILQWDGLEGQERNPVSWYFWHGGSPASQWGLRVGEWATVTCVFAPPHQWQCPDKFGHHGQSAFFALAGAVDSRGESSGLALFPENLRSEYHAVRAVIEAHSQKGKLTGGADGNANGLAVQKNSTFHLTVRVRASGGLATYKIDRWD